MFVMVTRASSTQLNSNHCVCVFVYKQQDSFSIFPVAAHTNGGRRATEIKSKVASDNIYPIVLLHFVLIRLHIIRLGTLLSALALRTHQIACLCSCQCPFSYTFSFLSFFPSIHIDRFVMVFCRFLIGQYVTIHGDVISHVNISHVMVEDGGEYSCTASNRAGKVSHAARLNVYGKFK